jgi:hypothetical protein
MNFDLPETGSALDFKRAALKVVPSLGMSVAEIMRAILRMSCRRPDAPIIIVDPPYQSDPPYQFISPQSLVKNTTYGWTIDYNSFKLNAK